MSSFLIRQWYREQAPNDCRELGEGDRLWNPKSYSFEIYSQHKFGGENRPYAHNPRSTRIGRPTGRLEVEFGPLVSSTQAGRRAIGLGAVAGADPQRQTSLA